MAGRINRDSFDRLINESADRPTPDQLETLQRDVTKLTIAIEELAKIQKQQQEDLTKATIAIEQKVAPK